MRSVIATLLLLPLLPAATGPAVAWEKDYDAALARAKAEGKALFVAVNMDGERANDTLAEKVYQDKEVVALSEKLVCLVASRDEHAGAGKACPRFGAVSCAEHLAVEARVRKELLKPGPDGAVVSPQHVFLGPDGAVLMSVPYEIGKQELLWCLVTALEKADPAAKMAMPAGARAPRRLIMAGVYESGDPATATRPLSEDELEETIAQIRAGLRGEEAVNAYFRVISTDHPDAVKFVTNELKGAVFGLRVELRIRLLHGIGVYSPPSFWPALELYVKDQDEATRNEVAVALEQLAAPESVKDLRAAFDKEKVPSIQRNLLRALGTAGADDKNARKLLLKEARSDKDPAMQLTAVLALGPHHADEEAGELLRTTLREGDARFAQAAALALAFARADGFREDLEAARGRLDDAEAKARLERVLQVLDGANLSLLKDDFAALSGDPTPRERFFGR